MRVGSGDGGDILHHVISLIDILVSCFIWPYFLFSYFDFGSNTYSFINIIFNTSADVLY